MAYIASKSTAHCDLAARNILVGQDISSIKVSKIVIIFHNNMFCRFLTSAYPRYWKTGDAMNPITISPWIGVHPRRGRASSPQLRMSGATQSCCGRCTPTGRWEYRCILWLSSLRVQCGVLSEGRIRLFIPCAPPYRTDLRESMWNEKTNSSSWQSQFDTSFLRTPMAIFPTDGRRCTNCWLHRTLGSVALRNARQW